MNKIILFVYGTLKRGQRNVHHMAGQEFLHAATTKPIYRLHSLGTHPGMVVDLEHGLPVSGELWTVDATGLAHLDDFEGVPHPYQRQYVSLADGTEDAQAYFYVGTIPDGAISGGTWPLPS